METIVEYLPSYQFLSLASLSLLLLFEACVSMVMSKTGTPGAWAAWAMAAVALAPLILWMIGG